MKDNKYEQKTLSKLRKKYSKDDVVSMISKRLTEKEILIGKLKAEIDYLTHERDLLSNDKKLVKRLKRDELYKSQQESFNKLSAKYAKAKNENIEFISKIAQLNLKLSNYEKKSNG